ncbi:unnamed protein product [Spirodela intermedia]|uniref:Translation initiation factor eIF2B subunit alpha n=1 Tax=Spirodela intermedia TaxID=51605 RepID=A0A7I8IMT5_SPIIN|nr:unnamed protein product [Spirodela intermedia]CAA6659286.1 unnamed protein product [Spirodela intermedia]
MWKRSASFVLDNRPQQSAGGGGAREQTLAAAAATAVSGYYQTRAEHHVLVSEDWLEQAEEAACGGAFDVIDEFNFWRKKPDLAEAVAAIMALSAVIRSSEATTMMELEIELKKASDALKSSDLTSISLSAGCDLFTRYVTRTKALEYEDFDAAKSHLIERGRNSASFLSGMAAMNRKIFRVLCTGRPDSTGVRLAKELGEVGIQAKLLIDSAVAYAMDEVDMVFVGADGVVESGGIINMMGTYQTALVAHSMNKPVYVAAECYKFARLYPLDQKDLAPALRPIDFGTTARDYTPPQYLTLLFTDLGVLTPSAVSDELIKLYL